MSFQIKLPTEYNHDLTLQFLSRSPKENLHFIENQTVTKLLLIDNNPVLISIEAKQETLKVEVLNKKPSPQDKELIERFIVEWFDLDSDLKMFYALAKKDELLKPLVKKFYGYRIIGQPDLFESLIWAVLGQQINLSFAYTLKQRFVETFGSRIIIDKKDYYVFPTPKTVAQLTDVDLLPLQFSRQKSKYTVNIAKEFTSGNIAKEKLKGLPLMALKEELMKVKGIGNWTANYAIMKTFRYPDAFPLEDAGLHNAIKNQLQLKGKPSLDRVKKIFKKYKGWEAYVTLYLWKSL
jgi:DNA-3-methyladenine glycosylase II